MADNDPFSTLSQLGQGWNISPKYAPVYYRYNGEITARILKDGKYLSKVGVFHPDIPAEPSDNIALSYGYDWKVTILTGGITLRTGDQSGDNIFDMWLNDRQDLKRIGPQGFTRPKVIEIERGYVWLPAGSWHRIDRLNPYEKTVLVYEAWKDVYRDPTRIVTRQSDSATQFDSDTYSDDQKWNAIEEALAEL